jgi:glutamate-1-semialdehyde 2,1-aminomutase
VKSDRSQTWFERAQKVIPGGVNSPVRAFRGVGGVPRFIERAQGSRIFDTDGNSYIDYVGSYSSSHRPQPVIDALREVLDSAPVSVRPPSAKWNWRS